MYSIWFVLYVCFHYCKSKGCSFHFHEEINYCHMLDINFLPLHSFVFWLGILWSHFLSIASVHLLSGIFFSCVYCCWLYHCGNWWLSFDLFGYSMALQVTFLVDISSVLFQVIHIALFLVDYMLKLYLPLFCFCLSF